MDSNTLRFLCFVAFSALSLAFGYAARKRGWLREEDSRPIHWYTVVWIWPLAAMLSVWNLPLAWPNLWLFPIEVLLVLGPTFGVIPLARRMGCGRRQIGVLAVSAGLGNLGFTLGGYLCYVLVQPGEQALAYAVAQVSVMAALGMALLQPVAMHYGSPPPPPPESPEASEPPEAPAEWRSYVRLVVRSLLDLRSSQMYGALAGLALALLSVSVPRQVHDWFLMDVLFYLGAAGGYVGIGLCLRLGDWAKYLREHALLAGVKFLAIPALTVLALYLISRSPWPLPRVGDRVILIEAFMPAAIQAVITANLFDLDARLASVAWVVNAVVFCVIPLPVILWLMG